MSKKIKKLLNNKYFILVLVSLLIVLVIGTGTYAWLTWSSPDTTKLTVTIGNIADVVFNTGNDINTTSLSPVFTYDQGEKTNFSIVKRSSASGTNVLFTVSLNITSIADELKTTSFKYVLIKDNSIVAEGNFSTASSGDTISLYSDAIATSQSYEFIIYIDGNEENNTNMMNKTFNATLNVTAQGMSLPENAATYITNLYTNTKSGTITNNSIEYQVSFASLINDKLGGTTTGLDDGNIRYYGTNPRNYIYFNCSDYDNQSSDTCETWRIIGVFDDKLKLIRNESIGGLAWDQDKNDDSSKTTYDNDWSTATLQKLLNESYYNGTDTIVYYSRKDGSTSFSLNMTSIGIKNDITRNMIAEATWNLGGWDSSVIYPNQIYTYERGTAKCTSCTYETTWNGKIALMYPSDYGYAADFSKCRDSNGNDLKLSNYNDITDSYQCRNNNWMFSSAYQWLLTSYTANTSHAWVAALDGYIGYGTVYNPYEVVPVLYLDSELKIVSGDGSSNNPYKLNA